MTTIDQLRARIGRALPRHGETIALHHLWLHVGGPAQLFLDALATLATQHGVRITRFGRLTQVDRGDGSGKAGDVRLLPQRLIRTEVSVLGPDGGAFVPYAIAYAEGDQARGQLTGGDLIELGPNPVGWFLGHLTQAIDLACERGRPGALPNTPMRPLVEVVTGGHRRDAGFRALYVYVDGRGVRYLLHGAWSKLDHEPAKAELLALVAGDLATWCADQP
jgi:hypothetical protein